MRLFVIFLAMLSCVQFPLWGQRSGNRKAVKKEKITVEALMDQYRFTEAIERLEADIAQATRRKKPTEALEATLEKARSLAVMVSATEKVYFIDSMVVDKQKFLSAMHFGEDCGSLDKASALVPEGIKARKLGEVAYRNELANKIYFSQQVDGLSGLFMTEKVGDAWSRPKALRGIAQEGAVQDYPYVMSDGVTLYYADQREDGVGGYDIYVTRYNAEKDEYLKAENIGMPFNSPANDYMYVIDEVNRLGWFVSDRYQPEGKVCIYVFQPNETRQLYDAMAVGEDWLREVARLTSIRNSMLNQNALAKAKRRLQEVIDSEPDRNSNRTASRFLISDDKIYTSLLQFKSKEAQRLAIEWSKEKEALDHEEERLDRLRKHFDATEATAADRQRLMEQENLVYTKREAVNDLAKKMRRAELQRK